MALAVVLRPRTAGALTLLLAAACADLSTPEPPDPGVATEYVTRRRAWLPAERDSLVARIVRTRQFSLPYVGDLSDYADVLLPADSAVEIVLAPRPIDVASPFGAVQAVPHVPGTGWSTVGLDIKLINTDPVPDDTVRWLGWLWFRTADSTNKGFVFAHRAPTSNTIPATFVNTSVFDAAFGKAGAGGGEISGAPPASLTFWQADGWVRRNTMSMTLNFAFGGSTVTTGPYTGGTQAFALMSGVLDSVRLDRVSGSAAPATQYASVTLTWVGGVRLVCVFPSPCTTNALMDPRVRAWASRGASVRPADR